MLTDLEREQAEEIGHLEARLDWLQMACETVISSKFHETDWVRDFLLGAVQDSRKPPCQYIPASESVAVSITDRDAYNRACESLPERVREALIQSDAPV